jgi:diguanylate cyclase (GGDEF)-like protein
MHSSRGSRLSLFLASLLLITALSAGTAIVVYTSTSRTSTVALADDVAPASLLLLNLDRDADQADLFLERVVHLEAAGLDAIGDRIGYAENTGQLLGDRWTQFREIGERFADRLPGEARRVETFETDRDIWLATAERVLAMSPSEERDLLVAVANDQFTEMRDHLDVLEEEFWEPQIAVLGSTATRGITIVLVMIIVAMASVVAITVALTIANIVAFRRQAKDYATREGELLENTRRQSFETVMRRALEMAHTEAAALDIVARATEQSLPRVEMSELLLSDTSRSSLRSVRRRAPGTARGCGVTLPGDCRAVATGTTQIFGDSAALDACPHLADRDDARRTAVCVPVSINGRASGTLHAVRTTSEPFDERDQATLTAIANHTGIQLSVLRNQEIAAHQASTDPLTGLANRRSLEAAVHRMREASDSMAVLMIDLDHFKELNDTHGHETGDRALRVFADAARDVTFDDHTIAARWGGEEFVIVLAGGTADDGMLLAEQLREALSVKLLDASTPGFTVSIGVVSTESSRPLDEALELADQALYEAKEAGRDRVVVG